MASIEKCRLVGGMPILSRHAKNSRNTVDNRGHWMSQSRVYHALKTRTSPEPCESNPNPPRWPNATAHGTTTLKPCMSPSLRQTLTVTMNNTIGSRSYETAEPLLYRRRAYGAGHSASQIKHDTSKPPAVFRSPSLETRLLQLVCSNSPSKKRIGSRTATRASQNK